MHQLATILTLIIYISIVHSYIWARLKFFKISSSKSRIGSIVYDPLVAVQIVTTIYLVSKFQDYSIARYFVAGTAYSLSLFFFWWAIGSCSRLDFALSNNVGNLMTSGPFGIVRHPFYVSYIVTWATSTLLFPSIPLWTTLILLGVFYCYAAVREEQSIQDSKFGNEYREYKNEVGMFLPKATQWRKWFSELSRIRER